MRRIQTVSKEASSSETKRIPANSLNDASDYTDVDGLAARLENDPMTPVWVPPFLIASSLFHDVQTRRCADNFDDILYATILTASRPKR